MTNNFKLDDRYTNALSYDDVFIIPKYSDISSRKEVDISTKINNKIIKVPIMNANMESIADEYSCSEVRNAGGVAALHRFQDIGSACREYLLVVIQGINKNVESPIFVSIGVNRDSKERAQELYNVGAREFIIDIAHGDSYQMKQMIQWMKANLSECFVMAGNVGTGEAVRHLGLWGADAIKCGIAGGAVCVTKNVTGVVVPMFSCLQDCVIAKNDFEQKFGRELIICADGGVREIGDIAKAVGLGCNIVMSGKMFAGCIEAPGKGRYSGSASSDVQTMYRTDKEYVPTPEGKSIVVDSTGESAGQVVEHIAGGIRSSCSYVGARNIKEFQEKCTFGTRHNKT